MTEVPEQTNPHIEQLLAQALAPVEPPAGMFKRIERRLQEATDRAHAELARPAGWSWRHPLRGGRKVLAIAVLAGAGAVLAVLGLRRYRPKRKALSLRLLRRG